MMMMVTALKMVKFAMMMMILLTWVPSERRLLSADFCRPQLQVTSVLCQQPWLARRWWEWLWMTKRYKFFQHIIQEMFDNWYRGNDDSTCWWGSTRSRICSMSTRLIRSKYNVSMISKLPGLWTWREKRSITRQWLATTINCGNEAQNFVQNDWTLNLDREEKKLEQLICNCRDLQRY